MLRNPFIKKLGIWIIFHGVHDVALLLVARVLDFPITTLIGGVLVISLLVTLLSAKLEKMFR